MDGSADPLYEPCQVHEGEQASARLHELRLDPAILRQAVEAGDNGRGACGPFHPDQSRGHRLWGDTVAALRELTVASAAGWAADKSDRFDTARNDALGIVVAVMGADHRTGQRGPAPRVRRKRGPATRARVVHNANITAPLFTMPGARAPEAPPELPELWVLLLHCDEEAIRCELSRPVGFDERGRVARWAERILLTAVPSSGGVLAIDDDDDDDDEPFGVVART